MLLCGFSLQNNSFEKVIEMFNLTRLMFSFIGAYTQAFW